jgi:3'(2'), 5'-bisphosphate nucleotidase
VTVFIDPIDGTREFSSNKGEQCTICIGFAIAGRPVAGLVYRPVPTQPTWALGCTQERLYECKLDLSERNEQGFLCSAAGISPFLEGLLSELGFEKVGCGGAGNKMLMLLEGKGACYIQDRAVYRWDTCAAAAILEAVGGTLSNLRDVVDYGLLKGYTYVKSDVNADFVPNGCLLSKYNVRDQVGECDE